MLSLPLFAIWSKCMYASCIASIGVDYSTVSRSRLKTKIKSSPKLNQQFRQILEQIENFSNSKIGPCLPWSLIPFVIWQDGTGVEGRS